MPHQFLGQISGNFNYRDDIEKRFELIFNWHSHIVDYTAGEQTTKIISQDLNITSFTIQNIIDWAVSCFDNELLHWSSHSNIVFDFLHHHLFCEVHVNFKIYYRDVRIRLRPYPGSLFSGSRLGVTTAIRVRELVI